MSTKKENDSQLHHNSAINPICMGCRHCPEFKQCGGLAIGRKIYTCLEFCKCDTPEKVAACTHVCTEKPVEYALRVREVGTFGLSNVPAAPPRDLPTLPTYVPVLKDGAFASSTVSVPVYAVRLDKLFSKRTGNLLMNTAEELSVRFHTPVSAPFIITGVGFDPGIEKYWREGRSVDLAHQLKSLNPMIISTPNFSLFTDLPRLNDLHSIKRIALTWSELANAGHNTALHLNGRTDKDFDNWTSFLKEHTEIKCVSFEFCSGAVGKRAPWYVSQLASVAQECARPLTLLLRAGVQQARQLRPHFSQVCTLDCYPYMATVKRQKLQWQAGKGIRKQPVRTASKEPLDQLFISNLETTSKHFHHVFAS